MEPCTSEICFRGNCQHDGVISKMKQKVGQMVEALLHVEGSSGVRLGAVFHWPWYYRKGVFFFPRPKCTGSTEYSSGMPYPSLSR